jgi:hypothetical protein
LFQQWEKSLDPRYLALPLIACAFFFGGSLGLATERSSGALRSALQVAVVAFAAVLIALETLAFGERFERDYAQTSDPVMTLFREVRQAIPEGAVVAGTDVGALAFWTGRSVINLDGVINNWEYQDYLRDRRLAQYLRDKRVQYLVTPLTTEAPTYTGRPIEPMYRHLIDPDATRGIHYGSHDYYVYSYVHHVYSDRIRLTPAQEVFRKSLGVPGGPEVTYVVYRLAS